MRSQVPHRPQINPKSQMALVKAYQRPHVLSAEVAPAKMRSVFAQALTPRAPRPQTRHRSCVLLHELLRTPLADRDAS